ncbi:hypothetical protein [Thalassobaculum sp.]|uniref:hypothetical protein n=1 Tax=Thalassobaculum sp. TaxID=2022740 RepID=UPI0032ED78A4
MVSVSPELVDSQDASGSCVSWAAIIAGALAASALSLVLLILGTGIGLTMVSPWSAQGAGTTAIAASAAAWLVFTQWASSGIGGYVAGRMRLRWPGVDRDEVLFRDTAHGLLVWALATVLVTGLLVAGGAATVRSGGSAVVAFTVQDSADAPARTAVPTDYFADMLFRPGGASTATGIEAPGIDPSDDDAKGEASRILVIGLTKGDVPASDKVQLAHLVATRTGMSPSDAQARVNDVLGQIETTKSEAKAAAEDARKAGLTIALVSALSLFVGAFIAGVAAAIGGRQRDLV